MALIPPDQLVSAIHVVRGHRVILDSDLAGLYGVQVRVLNQAVRRNATRFPDDFMFQLTDSEVASLRSQIVILKKGRGRHLNYHPYGLPPKRIGFKAEARGSLQRESHR